MTDRVINFNPGPSTLPVAALERAQKELLNYEGSGMSIMEHSHRGKEYDALLPFPRRLRHIPNKRHTPIPTKRLQRL